MIRFAMVAAACALSLSTPSALAAASSSASISGLDFTLIDLNPRDGIAASFSFVSSSGSTLLSLSAADDLLSEADAVSRRRAGTFAFSGQFLADLQNSDAAASISDTKLSASGKANGPSTSYSATASTGSTPNYYYPYTGGLNLSVSAHTLLIIEAAVDLYASATNPSSGCYSHWSCQSSESATASASLALSYGYSTPTSSITFNDNKTTTLQADAYGVRTLVTYESDPAYPWYWREVYTSLPATSETKSFHDVLSTVFTNSSNLTQFGSLNLVTSVTGRGTTAAIPEPQSYVLFMAGLGFAGLLAGRRSMSA